MDALSEGLRSTHIVQSLGELEVQAAADSAAIEALKTIPTEALILPHPSHLVQRALNLREMFQRDPVAGREALRHLLGGQPIVLTPHQDGHYVAETRIFPLLPLVSESSGNPRGTGIGCAGPQLDFPAQQFRELAEVWVPFEKAIVIGWR